MRIEIEGQKQNDETVRKLRLVQVDDEVHVETTDDESNNWTLIGFKNSDDGNLVLYRAAHVGDEAVETTTMGLIVEVDE